ncbi:type VI secretion system Vgr family protein [Paraburkholderia caribensis]|uniref:type VI secretion system Vgr family protein n=1 Tax=Paraburkholderia caribensis TaxID=75105 RepID=UPI001D098F07|nr:type VI secretion system Vgr family protein [Paraburkholderia caribensis]
MGASMFNPLQTRTLSVHCDAFPTWGNDEVLAPVRLRGTEALGKLYRYELDLMTVDSPTLRVYQAREMIRSDKLIGAIIDITVEFEGKGTFIPGMPGNTGAGNIGAGRRTITGLIADVQITGSDDRHMYYRFIVRPSLWLTKKTVENRIFQNRNVVEVTEEVLADYNIVVEQRLAAPGFDTTYPARDYVRQFWCSDFEFLTMLWREWGIYYLYDGSKLVLCDSPGSHKKHHNMYDEVRYHAPDGARIDEEHIHRLEVSRRITTGQVDVLDYDYTRSRAMFTAESYGGGDSPTDHGAHYQWGDYSQPLAGAQGLSSRPNDYDTEARHLANVRLDAMRCHRQRLKGTGNLRGLATGKTLWLVDHPEKSVNAEYLVVSTTIDVRNNGLEAQRTDGEAAYQCVTDFVLQPANIFFKNRPKKKPRAHAETAVVTSYDDRTVWPDAYARVKAHFVWDRRNKPDLNSSCWLRVASPWQGNGYGFIAIPRIGDEVTISYHEGDPDKPFVSASKANQFNQPPWKLPDNLALTGLRSRDLKGLDSNHVLTDDTPGKLQVQVASDHAQSRLVLGYNTRIDGRNGRTQPRGEGFELATNAWGVLRANRGMLVTTESRSGADAPVKDIGETVQRLTEARDVHENLVSMAQQNQAQDAGADQSEVTAALKTQIAALKGLAKSSDASDFPEFTEPHLTLASPGGIESTTEGSTHIASGKHIALTSGAHVAVAAAGSLFASIGSKLRLFVQNAGMRLVAAGGDIDIHALKDSINLLAKLNITHTANRITITAKEELLINGGGSYTRWNGGGVETGTDGTWVVHSGSRSLTGPKSVPAEMPILPKDVCIECLLKRALSRSAFVNKGA